MSNTRIKIVSNPYKRSVGFEYQDSEKWRPINSINTPHSILLRQELTEGFFPFRVEDIVRTIIKEYYVDGNVIDIVFEGTTDDYEELVAVCRIDEYKDCIRCERSERYLRNAREVLPEIIEVPTTVSSLTNGVVIEDDKLKQLLAGFYQASNDIVPILIVGQFSSGKSTFINALIGQELLPSGDDPVTAHICKITRSNNADGGSITFAYEGSSCHLVFCETGLVKGLSTTSHPRYDDLAQFVAENGGTSLISAMRCALLYIHDLDADAQPTENSEQIDIEVPFNAETLLSQGAEFVIFDTPGANNAGNLDHEDVLNRAMQGFTNGLPIFVTTYDHLEHTSSVELFDKIESMESVDEQFAMIVINKADSANLFHSRLKSADSLKERILDTALVRRLHAQGLFFVSSVAALGAKASDELDDYFYSLTFNGIKQRYSDPTFKHYQQLYLYDIMPRQISDRIVHESRECNDLMLANSGMYSIEHEIARFSERYSVYNKCQQSLDILGHYIENISDKLSEKQQQAQLVISGAKGEIDTKSSSINDRMREHKDLVFEGAKKDYKDQATKSIDASHWFMTKDDLTLREGQLREEVTGAQGSKREIQMAISKRLLESVASEFEKDARDMVNEFDGWSRNFWEEKAHVLRDSLIVIATDSEGLLPERYSELESISIEFPKLHLELKGDEVFTYENFDASFRVFGFLVLQYGVIDYDQICETYKAEVAGVLKAIRETVTRRHVKEFDSFASRLLQTIHTNIELYNPEIIELIKQLDSERTRLDDLERRARGLEGCRQSISSLIDWRR